MRSCLYVCLVAASLLALSTSAQAAPPQWIWSSPDAATKAEAGSVYFRKAFEVAEPESGELEISADNSYELFVNGRNVGAGEGWNQRTKYKIGPLLTPGRNLIAVHAKNAGPDPAGLMVKATIKSKGKPAQEIVSDGSWKFATKVGGRWAVLDFSDEKWAKVHALGEYGKSGPWGPAGKLVDAPASLVPIGAKSQEKGLFELRDGDRVVLLGGTFIERLQNDGYFETALTVALPHKHITYRNLGWSGDTVWGDSRGVFGGRAEGFKRLVSDVALCKPTVIVVCYGQNEAYAGEEGLADFEQGLNALLDALEPTGARIVLLTPPPREAVGPAAQFASEYNTQLQRYCHAIGEAADQRGHTHADLFGRLQNAHASERHPYPLTHNGQHFTPYGNWCIAKDLVKLLTAPYDPWSVEIDVARNTLEARGTAVSELKADQNGLSFVATDRRLPRFELARGDYPAADYIPLASQTIEVAGLPAGRYEILIDGQRAGELEVNNDDPVPFAFDNAALGERQAKLRRLIDEKNTLFFHRYRPQNETYLFLFRKHEQGNNAVEIPMFDPLIEEKEKQIAQLRQPLKQKYELRRVSR